jgi:hypothetical protein
MTEPDDLPAPRVYTEASIEGAVIRFGAPGDWVIDCIDHIEGSDDATAYLSRIDQEESP